MSDLTQELKKIEAAIAAQEELRGTLSDEQIEAALAPLRAKKAELEARLPAASSGGVQVGSGAVASGGGKAVGERGVYVGGSVGGTIVTGDKNRVKQTIRQLPQANEQEKEALAALLEQLQAAVAQVPPAQQAEAQELEKATEELIEEAAEAESSKTRIQITGEGLKKAAENIAGVMPIVGQIVAAIFRITGVPIG